MVTSHLAKPHIGWTKQKLCGLAYLVQVPCPPLATISKHDLAHVIVKNLCDLDMPSANALLQLPDCQICGDCDSPDHGEVNASILSCDRCQEQTEAQDANHDWVVVLQQLALGKLESSCVVDGELKLSKPDEIGALRLLGVGLSTDIMIDDQDEASLTLCNCICGVSRENLRSWL